MTDQDPANLPGGTDIVDRLRAAFDGKNDPLALVDAMAEIKTLRAALRDEQEEKGALAAEMSSKDFALLDARRALAEEQEAKRVMSTQLREARAALEPFADMADMYDWGCADDAPLGGGMNVGHARNARAALERIAALPAQGKVELTPPTEDQLQYLDEIQRASGQYNPNAIVGGVERERALEEAANVALEQRCERGTPWDLACVAIAREIRALRSGAKG